MNLLERVKKIRGAEAALGLTFAGFSDSAGNLPKGAVLLGYSDKTLFCRFRHYEETVFAVTETNHTWQIHPIAYNFREFLRLIIACGCAELCARSVHLSEDTFLKELDAQRHKTAPGLKVIRDALAVTPIEDPYRYTHMVGQIIDCSRIGRK